MRSRHFRPGRAARIVRDRSNAAWRGRRHGHEHRCPPATIGRRAAARRQGCHRHRLDQRHRPGHRPRPGRGRRQRHAQRLRRGRRRSHGCATSWRASTASRWRTIRRRHEPSPTQIEAHGGRGARRRSARVDILVNNAGIQHVAPIEEFPPAKWDAILAINLSAAFHTTRAAIPGMRRSGWGRIVNIASAHGLVASPFKSAYVAAKHGLVGLTKVDGAGARRGRHHLQRRSARAMSGRRWSSSRSTTRPSRTASRASRWSATCCSTNQPNKRFATVEEMGALDRVPVLAAAPPRSPAPPCPSTAAGRPLSVRHLAPGLARVAARPVPMDPTRGDAQSGTDDETSGTMLATHDRTAAAPDRSRRTSRAQPCGRPGGAGLQGGGALGAYQVGVYQALHEAGIEPDWVVGTSIGAINASLIAGNEPGDRLARLEEFWGRVEHGPLHRLLGAVPVFGPLVANMLTVAARHSGLLPAQPDGLHGAARAARAGSRRLLRHGAAAGDPGRAGRFRPDQPQAHPADRRRRQCRHRRDALLRQPRRWRSTSAT